MMYSEKIAILLLNGIMVLMSDAASVSEMSIDGPKKETPFIHKPLSSLGEDKLMKEPSEILSAGARLDWCAYPAEEGKTNAKVLGPSREYGTFEAEAVGRKYVRLSLEGDYVDVGVLEAGNGMVLRYCIPDAPDGGGLDATLSLYINGCFEKKLNLTSRYAWHYGDYPWTNHPSAGIAHHFFDEINTFIPSVSRGDVIRLQKDADDAAEFYLIDFVELEKVGPPRTQPEKSLSINDFSSLEKCISAAKKEGLTVWIPPGEHRLDGGRIHAGGITVQGAGMWYSRLTGTTPMFEGTGEPIKFSDLAIFGEIAHRDNEASDNAFNGNLGDGSVFSDLWIEHMKCGFWTTHGTLRLTLRNSRIRNVMADGLNFCDGTSYSSVENCHLRNTGDDALASWSPTGEWSSKKPCVGNRFLNNTIEQPWLANGIAVYGGADHVISGNHIRDTVISGAGIHISSGFEAVPMSGTIRVENNRIEGAGGDAYIGETVGAVWLYAKDSDVDAAICIDGLRLIDSAEASITFHGKHHFSQVAFANIRQAED